MGKGNGYKGVSEGIRTWMSRLYTRTGAHSGTLTGRTVPPRKRERHHKVWCLGRRSAAGRRVTCDGQGKQGGIARTVLNLRDEAVVCELHTRRNCAWAGIRNDWPYDAPSHRILVSLDQRTTVGREGGKYKLFLPSDGALSPEKPTRRMKS